MPPQPCDNLFILDHIARRSAREVARRARQARLGAVVRPAFLGEVHPDRPGRRSSAAAHCPLALIRGAKSKLFQDGRRRLPHEPHPARLAPCRDPRGRAPRDDRPAAGLRLGAARAAQRVAAPMNMLPEIDRWPSEDQEALLEAARSIEAKRTGAYRGSEAELAAIDGGLDDALAGRFASEMRWRRSALSSAANDPAVGCMRRCPPKPQACPFFGRNPLMTDRAAGTRSLSAAALSGLRTKPAIVSRVCRTSWPSASIAAFTSRPSFSRD